MSTSGPQQSGFLSRLVGTMLHHGNLTILLILVSLAIGVGALLVTPREEEPQIVVPLADVYVSVPGASAEEVEKLVAARLERLLAQIDGVEYVYSQSRSGQAVVTVRFFVNQDREKSLIKLYNKIFQNVDQVTPGIAGWVVKPVEIDDVPIVGITLLSPRYDEHELYRIAEEAVAKLQHVEKSARITIHGGRKRVLQVYLDTERLAAYGLAASEVARALQAANAQSDSGEFVSADRVIAVAAGPFLRSAAEVRQLLVGVHDAAPVYLRDVATVADGPEEVRTLSRFGFGPGAAARPKWAAPGTTWPAVTVAVAKQKGSNAVAVARAVEQALGELRGTVIPTDVEVRITRDYGETANAKVNDLVISLAEAMITVIALIALAMTLRVGLVVAVAVPITYAITLLVNHLLGYTINRVTLFALILALGMLVDDPIVNVENIARHLGLRREPRRQAILTAINEVLPPVVLATFAIIIAFLPMFFITGMMGPYMRPMAVNVPLAMLCSLAVSLFVTPWVADKLLPRDGGHGLVPAPQETLAYRLYHRLLRPLLQSRARVGALLAAVGVLFLGSVLLAALGKVPLKMLPFDNKNEFQVVIDLPAGTPLERTAVAVGEVERYLCRVPEVVSYGSVIGTASPMDFNGMVRHYYLRQGQHLADIRVNLLPRAQRAADSHAIVLRLRRDLAAIGQQTGANLKVVEMPPGPPVLATVVAEVCAPDGLPYDRLVAAARQVRARLTAEPGLVDVDDTTTAVQDKLAFHLDRDKAAQNGVTVAETAAALQLALGGAPAGVLHVTGEQNELPIILQLPRALRSAPERLRSIAVKGTAGNLVQLGEIGQFVAATVDQPIYHKNQRRVVFVTGEMAGRGPAYAVLALQKHFAANPLPDGVTINWRGEGEWQITLDVFRDLGIAFAVALFGIYILLVFETTSFLLPVVVMLSIPLTVIGIMPGFWLLNLIQDRPVGGFANPVFFTATAMIGMIALAGIVVRNGIILIDFIRHAVAAGMPVRDAVIASGAVRLRPILLTAGATLLGAWPITMDPIFGGLAWAFIFGLFASTVFTLVVIPAAYFLIMGKAAPPAA